MKYAILVCLAAYNLAEEHTPCVSPKQWEGMIYTTDIAKNFKQFGKLSYDETNMRMRITEAVEEGSTEDYYDTLFLYALNIEYKLNLKTRECTVTDLLSPFRPFGLPSFAKFRFESTLGTVGETDESIKIQVWAGDLENNERFESQVKIPGCVPVYHTFYSNETGVVESRFFDVTLGISDPKVFLPPSGCM